MQSQRYRTSRRIYFNAMACAILALVALGFIRAQTQNALPHLRKQGTATQLIVEGKPFLMLAGELGNSSSSSLEYMQSIWPKLARMNLNTVLVPVSWELIEPVEEKYDFALVDGLIQQARQYHIHIVPLWFGAWKNSMSTYVPAWVKTDQKRFPRSQDKAGHGMDILSPFSKANLDADARAFAALMRHIREVDSNDHTVIIVQVENEIGMIPDSRDRSEIANSLFGGQVPAELMSYLKQNRETLAPELRSLWDKAGSKSSGTWEEIFGRGPATDEIFMAWHYARYVNHVTDMGKTEYPLPMYVNAALIRPGYQPGQYPSAGPLPHLIDIWRAGAPKIDFSSPDIYFANFAEWCRKYDRAGNPMFIPETILGPLSVVNAFYSIGQHSAMGFSPFSIESAEDPVRSSITNGYDVLAQLAPSILEHQGNGTMAGLLPEGPEQRAPQQVRLNGYLLNVSFDQPTSGAGSPDNQRSESPSGGLIIATGPDEFVFAGAAMTITFEPDSPGDSNVGILSADEGKFAEGKWLPGRRMNGDQTHQGRHIRIGGGRYSIQRVKLYRYR